MNIFMDLEMQHMLNAPTEVRTVCDQEVIEIGAVALDDSNNEQGRFKTYVKPQYSSVITNKIKALTGITTGQVIGALVFDKAFHQFAGWCNSFEDPIIYSWSGSDLDQIRKECALKDVGFSIEEKHLLNQWRDLQKEFDDLVGSPHCMSLEHAINMCGLQEDGHKHDAYWDAWNTAQVYIQTRDKDVFKGSLKKIKEILDYDEKPVTLGNMIDMSAFSISA